MTNDRIWELFFKTGLPEAYLLAKHRRKQPKQTPSGENMTSLGSLDQSSV